MIPDRIRLTGFFGAATVAVIAQYLLVLTDCIVCGRELGELALGGFNLLMPVFSFVAFVLWLVASGSFAAYAKSLGRKTPDRSARIAGAGLTATLLSAGLLIAAIVVLKRPYFAFMGADASVMSFAQAFWAWYPLVIILEAVELMLFYLVYANGGAVTCIWAYLLQIIVNIGATYGLCGRLGMMGIALGSALSFAVGILALSPRFLLRGHAIRIRPYYAPRLVLRSLRSSFPDAAVWLFHALFFLGLVKCVIVRWDSESLAVLAVVFCIIRLSMFFGGIGIVLRSSEAKDRFFEVASAIAFAVMAFAVSLFLIAPEPVIGLFGINEPELFEGAKFAARVTVGGLVVASAIAFLPLLWRVKKATVPEAPLNYLQSYVLARMAEAPDSQMFNLAKLFRLRRGVDLERLSAALVASGRSHEALLSAFVTDVDGELMQRRIFSPADVTCPVVKAEESELLAHRDELVRTFKVFGGKLFDAKIFDCGGRAYLLSNFHHLICDGYSFPLILEGARTIYEGGTLDSDAYYETLCRRRERSEGEVAAATRTVLREALSDPSYVTLPTADFRGASGYGLYETPLTLPKTFEAFLAERRLTRHHIFLAATVLALAKMTGAENVLIDWVFHGRVSKDELKTVGAFMVDLPLMLESVSELTTADVLSRVKQATFRGIKGVSVFRSLEDLNPDGRDRLTFNYQDEWGELVASGPVAADSPYGWMIEETMTLSAPVARAENPFNVEIISRRGECSLELEYDSGRYSESTVRRFADLYKAELAAILI